MFVLGDGSELKLLNFYRAFELNHTNIIEVHSPTDGLLLGGIYHFSLELNLLNSMKSMYMTKEITSRPITDTGLFEFGNWITQESWIDVLNASTVDSKA